ncbi:MAG: hypothetical protein Q8P57_05365 [Candidatus Pacearchaeota archaeon]|nr:hypothetical protein [Candidatus Pacearchaeota archaeon]
MAIIKLKQNSGLAIFYNKFVCDFLFYRLIRIIVLLGKVFIFMIYHFFMRLKEIGGGIYLITSRNKKELGLAFLRVQERYESSEFKGKTFSLSEFKEWYKKNNRGKFDYCRVWTAFNLPSYALNPLFDGSFKYLSGYEKNLRSLLKHLKGDFYVVGLLEDASKEVIAHEFSHAFFYLFQDYRKKVLKVLSGHDTKDIRAELMSWLDYTQEVLDDEVNSYILESPKALKSTIQEKLKKELENIFFEKSKEFSYLNKFLSGYPNALR